MRDGKYVILYIDDDQDYLDNMRLILEANDYIMEEAISAEEGLKVYKKVDPDFVIVDLMMEEVDAGTSFVKELRLLNNEAPVYMLSSVGDSLSLNTDYNELGLDGVFQKPINAKVLLSTLKRKLGQS
ncbi:MAG: two-component system response regulator [Candidatus Sumerlaeia bacterium]